MSSRWMTWADFTRRAYERPLPPAVLDDVARTERYTPAQIEHAAKLIAARYTAMPRDRRAFYYTAESAMRACCEELVILSMLDELLAAVALPVAVEYVRAATRRDRMSAQVHVITPPSPRTQCARCCESMKIRTEFAARGGSLDYINIQPI